MPIITKSVGFFETINRRNLIGASFLLFSLLAFARIFDSVNRLPPDPGYWFIEQSRDNGLLHIFTNQDGFLHIAPRLFAEVVNISSMKYQAIVASVLMQCVFVIVAVLIVLIVRLETNQNLLGLIAGLIVVLVPSASESTVGNLGSVKWPLTVALAVLCASDAFAQQHKAISVALGLIVGLSQPYALLFVIPGLISKAIGRDLRLISRVEGTVLITFAIQFIVWKFSGVTLQKYGEPTYGPWAGMGIFWYSTWLTPALTGIVVLIFAILLKVKFRTQIIFEVRLSVSALLIAVVAYIQFGIKDSVAVVPQILSWIALVLIIRRSKPILKTFFLPVLIVVSVMMVGSSIKWFSSGWFLSSGPTWSSEINRGVRECLAGKINIVKIHQFMGDTDLRCEELIDG